MATTSPAARQLDLAAECFVGALASAGEQPGRERERRVGTGARRGGPIAAATALEAAELARVIAVAPEVVSSTRSASWRR